MLGALPPAPEDLDRLRRAAEAGAAVPVPRGAIEGVDPSPAYRGWLLDRWKGLSGPPAMEVVLDAGNGAWSEVAPQIFERLGFRVHRLFCEIDSRFPNRPPDSSRVENLAALRAMVRDRHAALGIAWDGDGDRVAFVDATGAPVPADEIAALLARSMPLAG